MEVLFMIRFAIPLGILNFYGSGKSNRTLKTLYNDRSCLQSSVDFLILSWTHFSACEDTHIVQGLSQLHRAQFLRTKPTLYLILITKSSMRKAEHNGERTPTSESPFAIMVQINIHVWTFHSCKRINWNIARSGKEYRRSQSLKNLQFRYMACTLRPGSSRRL